jgi:hypothetical protein
MEKTSTVPCWVASGKASNFGISEVYTATLKSSRLGRRAIISRDAFIKLIHHFRWKQVCSAGRTHTLIENDAALLRTRFHGWPNFLTSGSKILSVLKYGIAPTRQSPNGDGR